MFETCFSASKEGVFWILFMMPRALEKGQQKTPGSIRKMGRCCVRKGSNIKQEKLERNRNPS